MDKYQKIFRKLFHYLARSKIRFIIFKLIGFNNYVSLIMKTLDIKGNNRANKKILCIERRFFEKDVDELSYRIRKYGWIWLKKSHLIAYQENLIPKKYRGQKNYINNIKNISDQWQECIRRSKILLKRLIEEQQIGALLISNTNYWQDYAIQVACKELEIPVIILQKEYPYNDLDLIQSFKNYYTSDNFKIADAIMVFGKRAKDIWSDSNLFDKKKIFVTGAPRIDRWRSLENFEGMKDGLLIITFKDEENKFEPFLEMVFSISTYFKKEKLGKIVIKSRNEIQSREVIDFCKKKNINNVEVIHFANIYDLVLQSKAIVCLNSLASVECMLSKVPIMIPDWFFKNKNKKMFNPEDQTCSKSVDFCENIDNLHLNIAKYLKNSDNQVDHETFEARQKFVSKFWEYDIKNSACKNVQNVIDSFIQN